MEILGLFLIVGLVAYHRVSLFYSFLSIGFYGALVFLKDPLFWIIYIPLAVILLTKEIREELISKKIVNLIKKNNIMPQISKTEEEALISGTSWIASEFFSGKPNFNNIYSLPYRSLSKDERSFLDNEVEKVCSMTSDWEIFQNRDLPKNVWDYLKEKKFFGMIIPKEYGGLGFSALGHSVVIEKLVSRSQVLAITTMVPNSLGPAELIMKYGTQEQKDEYLEKLATGKHIPCFGLTEPFAGSDAASIKAYGEIIKDTRGNLKISLNFEKRYITLGNIATVIGIAFNLKDPHNYLNRGEDLGITFALVKSTLKGVDKTNRHDPLGVPFYNSYLVGENVKIKFDDIVGGEEGIGKGWQMLMDSLSVGRGISLPSTSLGASKLASRVVAGYVNAREQFGLNIGKFEGIQEKIAQIVGFTYMQHAAKKNVLDAIDSGEKPAVLNSVMKYHATEHSRKVITDAMDILGGAGIIKGEKNLLAHLYTGAPVSITVEGANILTRNLMQFGQGIVRCHPTIYKEISALNSGDLKAFDDAFFDHAGLGFSNFVRTIFLSLTRGYFVDTKGSLDLKRYEQKIVWASSVFALLSDMALLAFGGGLKKKENISAKFADVISYLYLVSSVLREYKVNETVNDINVAKWVCEYGLYNIQKAFEEIIDNFTKELIGSWCSLGLRVVKFNYLSSAPSDKLSRKVANKLTEDLEFKNSLTDGIYLPKDEHEQLNILDRVYELYLSTKEPIKKAIEELKTKKLDLNILDELVKKSIITKKESDDILEFQKLKSEAVMVDSFNVNEYLKQR